MNTTFEREIKDKNYTVMSNYHLRDKNISLKAKGLLSQLLSYSANWTLTIKGLCAISKEQEKAMKNTIKELESHNYLTRQKLKDNKGRFYYKYIIHEKPKIYPPYQNLPMDNPLVEKDIQINTNLINNNKEDIKDKLLNKPINNKIIIDNNLILKKLIISNYIDEYAINYKSIKKENIEYQKEIENLELKNEKLKEKNNKLNNLLDSIIKTIKTLFRKLLIIGNEITKILFQMKLKIIMIIINSIKMIL